jgi:hypothetical protein
MSVSDDLLAAKANLAAELRLITSPGNRSTTYTINGRTYDWLGYRKLLMEQIQQINEQINVENPFEEEILGMT